MYTTPNMGLTAWDLPTDDFSHQQLQVNWNQLDLHDHSDTKGVQIGTAGIRDGAITQALLALGSVGALQLQDNSVTTSDIQDGAVTASKLAAGAVSGAALLDGSVVASKLDPTIVPLGQVSLWWRPPGSSAVPGGFWEAMDGRAWHTITNAFGLTTGSIPDTRGIFARGADLLASEGPAIGTTGGSLSLNLSHAHNVLGHTHGLPNHTHPIVPDGSHIHLWQGGLHMGSRTNCFTAGITVQDYPGGHQKQNTFYSMYIQNLLSNPVWYSVFTDPAGDHGVSQQDDGQADMDPAGNHSHGGGTGNGGAGSTNPGTATTDAQLGTINTTPSYVGLLYIMRCR